ncbi:Mib-herc2 [Phytophthora cactorum]|nr:Mib-herc2 [Phytophthora cactorum]
MAPPRRFVETEETFHFFNEDAVLGTNEIRSGDASSSSSDSDSSEISRLRRAHRRRRASSVASRRTSRRLSRLLNGSVVSELESLQDDSDEDDYDSLDDFELEDDDEEIHQPRERKESTDKADAEPHNTPPPPWLTPKCRALEPSHNGDWTQKKRSMSQQMQLRRARRAITAFTRRVHCANAYRYRKQSEFMRVCYQRALEAGPGYEVVETSKLSDKLNEGKKQALLVASQKEDAVETTVPSLFPRKWPHLPDTDAAIEFLSRLAELPETSLIYEPIDAGKFAAEVTELLELTRRLFAMGVQLQSFTLLSKAALQFIELGQATYLGDADGGSIRPELQKLLELYCSRLAQHVAEPILAATFPRDLSAQWKVCSYQPSTSDAIATDGLYLYIFGRSGLFKIGTGNGTTVRDFVYAHNKEYVRSRDAERSWLCCIGDALYCRTIVMPGHRVDRIHINDLQNVQELVLAPNCALIGKGTTESSVYAMVTDGVDLFTIRCIDTYKKSSCKTSSSRKHRSRSHKSRKSTPVSEIVNAVLGKSDSDLKSPPQSPEAVTINVGDRVVRGPDWKWSNQDGEKGSSGTVERISTWGGVKGSGVTVRWDKNQRVNTYRWGAEGCYDLYIVVENDGLLERKPLPNAKSSRKVKNGEGTAEGSRENEPEPLPRHQLVLYRHKVDSITSIMKLEEPDIDLFLDLTPSRGKHKQGTSGSSDAKSGVETLSALHSHTVTLCSSKTSWMCDGGMSNCFGDNAAKRYRCTSGCDFDLCESCLFATVIDKPSLIKAASESNIADDGASSIANTTADDTVPSADDGPVASDVGTPIESIASEGTDPFSTVDVSLFAESAREVSLKKKEEDKKKQKQQTEEQMKERTSAQRSSTWLHTCGAYLRAPMVIPTVSSVILAAKPKSGALDPVLLIAGTFFATHGQLCVVSPPGLYTVGEEHSDKAKRAASSSDASWFFSLDNGALLADKPVLLKGIPAGSPTCVDMTRKRILVFSSYLNCLEEYVDHVQQSRQLVDQTVTECATLEDTGKLIISQLAQLMRKRAAFPAYKHPRAGLQDILFRTGREPAPASTDKSSDHKDGDLTTKSKNRRIKNIRARLKELDRLPSKDLPGYIIPFCVDFEDEGLLQIFRAITYSCRMLSSKVASCDENGNSIGLTAAYKLVADLLRILMETVQEFEFVGVTMNIDASDEATQELFKDTEHESTQVARLRATLNDAAIFGGYQVVETPHPYNHTQPVFRRVVHIPGASVLHFEFDPRCRTSGEADIVFITSGLAWYQADRLPYGDVGFGEDGGCFFGSYSRGNWPAGGLTVVGDTATIMLCATTQARSGTGDKQRWGLKCTYFVVKQKEQGSCASTKQLYIAKSSDEAIYRLMCTVASKVAVLHEWPEVFSWWIQKAIGLVTAPNAPSNLSVASTRLIRYSLELLGDAMFDLKMVIPRSSETKMVLGMKVQDILLKRVGKIVSPLPVSDHAAKPAPSPTDSVLGEVSDHCVVIFQNEVATDKLVDAANSVGEPDVRPLEIPVEGSDGKDAVEKAITEAVAECTAAQATMKHPSVRCDGCNQSPLRGFRFKCFTCPNYDLCTSCYTNQTHNMDHPFVRLTDTAGTGDLLQPRSKGGSVVPETALVGSKPWKGNLLRVLLDAQGYVIYCFGSRRECCDTASALANLGFLVTVAHSDDMADVDSLHDWERSMQLFLEPGSSRLSHRRSSLSSEKNSARRAHREVINVFNRKAALINSNTRRSSQKVEDGRQLASEVIAVLRLMASGHPNMQRWRSSTLRKMTEILEDAPAKLPSQLARALRSTQVLGGFREPLRIGGNVSLSSYAADKARGGHTGVVYSYAFGNDDIVIANLDEAASDDDICFCKRTTSEVKAISGVPVDRDTLELLEPLVVPFCSVVRRIYEWTSNGKSDDADVDGVPTSESLLRWELACALIQSFSSMAPAWPSLFDNQVISTNGNCPAILFQLAQMCVRDLKVEDIADMRELLWNMEWLRSRDLHFSLATRPISSSSFSASDDKTDLPQHSGRNKMLEYWEKNVIPAIETYVSGSFKSYEMDYFFAQLREPLREGNAAAALKIAFTLCDDRRFGSWRSLVIASENVDVADWSRDMLWTLGHSGTVRVVDPSGMVLLQVVNPVTSASEYWWYHVDNLRAMSSGTSVSEQSVTDFEASRTRLKMMNQQLIYSIARKSENNLSENELVTSSVAIFIVSWERASGYDAADGTVLSSEIGMLSDSTPGAPTENSSSLYLRPKISPKSALITVLQTVLNKQFERAAASPPPPVMDRSTSYDENASKHKKRGKQGALAGKLAAVGASSVAASAASSSAPSSSGSSTSLKSTQPKLQQPDVTPALSTRKHRYLLMEALLAELKASLDLSMEYLIATTACLPANAKTAVYQITAKLINFALSKGAMHAVPIAKLSGLVKELTFVHDNERTTQKGLYSLYTQQLAELISLVEEVSSLKGGSSSILGGAWWKEFVRMAVFTRVLAQGKREIATPDAFKRVYCGRAPIREIQTAQTALASHDLFGERIIFLQNLPRTSNVAELKASISRFIVHLALEECGEADDQNVYSAAAVTRFGIVSDILFMPVDSEGQTVGYAMIDIGRADVIANLLTRISKETFEFQGGIPTEEDNELLARIEAVCRPPDSSSGKSNDENDSCSDGADPSGDVWACSVCTLENSLADAECAACGSPIPLEMANLARDVQSQSQSSRSEQPATGSEDATSSGWTCTTCTFVNSWADTTCDACTMERSADLVPPSSAARENSNQNEGDSMTSGVDTVATSRYKLSAARFTEMIRVADETSGVPKQVTNFLHDRFFENSSSTETDIGVIGMVPDLRRVLNHEASQYCSSSDSKITIAAFAALAGVTKNHSWDNLSGEKRMSKLTSVKALSEVEGKTLAVYKWLRSSGYDLQFELSHYGSMDDVMKAQAKWTHQMDCQLIAVCRELSGRMGVLMLTDLCPSHLSANHAREYVQIASLETRDLRLRFAVLQSLNKLLVGALPLVNLRPWSDPSSLRSRIVSIRQLIFPGVKIRFFAQTQDNTTLAHSVFVDTNAKRPMVTIDRRKIAGKRGASTSLAALRDPRRSLFASTMKQLSAISPSLLRAKRPTGASDPFVSFIVIFAGENVVGEGGPYRQLFNDISNELLASGNPLFIPTQNNAMKAGEFRERYMPKPSSTSKELLQMFEFVGILMGCCLRTGVRLNLRLAPLVWKMLVKQNLVLTDLESVDYSLCESLKFLEELASAQVTTLTSDGTVVELKTGGQQLSVTKANAKEYIRLVKATRLQECKPQVDAMLRGLGKIVPVQLLQLCVWFELQQWVSGSLEIDVNLLKRHTRYSSGMSPEQFPHLEMFWKVLSSFSEENKRRFINFAWGQTLPADDAEFDRTHTRLLIKAPPQDSGMNQDALLPKADTCFFNIELPVYSSEKIMREKLLLAITLCTSLDGDEQTASHDIYYAGDEIDDDAME